MPTLQIADKPTLDEINNKIDELYTLFSNNSSMKVPIAFNKGSLSNGQTLNLNGKGTVWIFSNGNSSQGFTATIDGNTPFSYTGFITLVGNSASNATGAVPIDFEKSISLTNTGSQYTLTYTYELYK